MGSLAVCGVWCSVVCFSGALMCVINLYGIMTNGVVACSAMCLTRDVV